MIKFLRLIVISGILSCLISLFPKPLIAQLSCPAFGRNQSSAKWELLLNWNTVDAYSSEGKIDFYDATILAGGNFVDKSLSPGLTIKYYVDDITVLRLKAIYIQRDEHDELNIVDSITGSNTYSENQFDQTIFKIAPGFQWTHLVDRFSIFGGFELPYTYIGEFKQTYYNLDSSTVLNYRNETNATVTVPGGYSVGLGLFVGSTFYYRSVFGIGFEISEAYQYSKIGGTIVYESETTGTNPSKSSSISSNTSTLWRFSASIQLSLRF
jgi:hypothetical protein